MPTNHPTGVFDFRFTRPPTSAPSNSPTEPPDSPFREFHSKLTFYPTSTPTTSEQPAGEPTDNPTVVPNSAFLKFHSTLTTDPTSDLSAPLNPASVPPALEANRHQETPLESPFRQFYSTLISNPEDSPSINNPNTISVPLGASTTPGGAPVSAPSVVSSESIHSPATGLLNGTSMHEEYQVTASLAVEGMPELLDPSSTSIVETIIVQYLSDEVVEVDEVPVFFLKTQVTTENPKNSIYGTIRMAIKTTVLASGETIDINALQGSIQQALEQDPENLESHLRGAIHSSATPTVKLSQHSYISATRVGRNNTIIWMATCVSIILIITISLSVCVMDGERLRIHEDSRSTDKPKSIDCV